MLHGVAAVGALFLPFSLTLDLRKVNGKLLGSLQSQTVNMQRFSSLPGVESKNSKRKHLQLIAQVTQVTQLFIIMKCLC